MRSPMNSDICGLTCRSPHVVFIFIEMNLVTYGMDVLSSSVTQKAIPGTNVVMKNKTVTHKMTMLQR